MALAVRAAWGAPRSARAASTLARACADRHPCGHLVSRLRTVLHDQPEGQGKRPNGAPPSAAGCMPAASNGAGGEVVLAKESIQRGRTSRVTLTDASGPCSSCSCRGQPFREGLGMRCAGLERLDVAASAARSSGVRAARSSHSRFGRDASRRATVRRSFSAGRAARKVDGERERCRGVGVTPRPAQ